MPRARKLDVVPIPAHLPNQRREDDDVVYTNERAKWKAVIEEIVACHEHWQPTFIGTVSVKKSEVLATLLRRRNIPRTVLNRDRMLLGSSHIACSLNGDNGYENEPRLENP